MSSLHFPGDQALMFDNNSLKIPTPFSSHHQNSMRFDTSLLAGPFRWFLIYLPILRLHGIFSQFVSELINGMTADPPH